MSGTVRSRTYKEAKFGYRPSAESLLQALQKVGSEQVELLRPDTRFAGHGDHPVTLRHGRRGLREPVAGDARPGGLNAREHRVGGDIARDVLEGGRERARGAASHRPALVGRTAGIDGVTRSGAANLGRVPSISRV